MNFPAKPTETKIAFSVYEAAKAASVSPDTLYGELNAGRLRARRVGRRTLIEAASLYEWLAALPAYAPETPKAA